MKRWMIALFAGLLLFIPLFPAYAQEEDANSKNGEQQTGGDFDATLSTVINGLDLDLIEKNLYESEFAQEILGNTDITELITGTAKGEVAFSAWNILEVIFSRFLTALRENLLLVLQLLAIALMMALLGAVGPSVLSGEIAKICQFIGYLVAVFLMVRALGNVYSVGMAAITQLTGVMQAVFPVLLTLMTALGSTASVGVFQPAMAILTGSIITLIQNISMPAIFAGGVLTIVTNMTERVQIKNASELVMKCAQWLTAVVFVVFLGVTALQGMTSATFDGISIRTTKYAIDKFIPIVGSMVSDTVDLLVGCSLVVKQGVGVVGMLLLCASILEPVLYMAAMALCFRVAAAVIEPFGESQLPQSLNGMARVFTLLFIAVLAAGAMMFILLTLLIRAGNINMMLR